MLTIFKAKLYPNASQRRQLIEYLDQSRYIFNKCLEIRRDAWRDRGESVTRFDQNKMLTQWRSDDVRLSATPAEAERDAIRRVDLAFDGFFRRIKSKAKKVGYPRFKSVNRYNSFTVEHCNPLKVNGRIKVPGIDKAIRCRGLQPITGTIKRLTVVRRADAWFARILVEDGTTTPELKPIKSAIGIDLGLNAFIATSNGETVVAPKHYRKLEGQLRRANKRVSRRTKGSNRRKRAILQLQHVHAKIQDARSDFNHKLSKRLVNEHQLIVAEKLNIKGMVKSKLAKSILDAGWGQFCTYLDYKAVRAGGRFVQVDPYNTSQECSRCGKIVPKELSERTHRCPHCGLVLDRDVNSAKVVLSRGLKQLSTPPSGRDGVQRAEAYQTRGPPTLASPLKRAVLT